MMSVDEALLLLDARTTAYSSLSRLFRREVDRALFERVTAAETGEWLGEEFCGQRGESTEALRELASDYAHLFFFGAGSVHPYESVYTSDKGLLMQGAFRDARKCYADAGFVVSRDSDEMADHIALELEFVAHLSRRTREALIAGDNAAAQMLVDRQRSFHHVHLNWVARFAQDVAHRAETIWYRRTALMLDDVVASDGDLIDELAAWLKTNSLASAKAFA